MPLSTRLSLLTGPETIPITPMPRSSCRALTVLAALVLVACGSPHGSGLPHSGMWVNFRSNIGVAF